MNDLPVLTILLLLPATGAGVVATLPGERGALIRRVAIAVATLAVALAWGLLSRFDTAVGGLQWLEQHAWNPRLGTSFSLGLDGFSYPMVLLATLLSLVALLASRSIRERVKGYYVLVLVLETAMLGVFMAQDWSLFYVFWEATLIPLFFLIDRWGGKNRQTASLELRPLHHGRLGVHADQPSGAVRHRTRPLLRLRRPCARWSTPRTRTPRC